MEKREGQDEMERLARLLADKVNGGLRTRLRLVSSPSATAQDDAVTRECRLKRIRWLARAFRLQWLVDQHCFGFPGPDCLEKVDLIALHKDMERARECTAEGISFEDAGLIRASH
jgi:hypothetical protein